MTTTDNTQHHSKLGNAVDKAVEFMEPLAANFVPAAWAGADDETDYDKNTTIERHTEEKVRGKRSFVEQDTKTDEKLSGQFNNQLMELVDGEIQKRDQERQQKEDFRANKRNFNRMLTLIGALIIGLFVTYMLSSGVLGHLGTELAPYSFVITILMDTGLALYGYVKKY